MSLDLVTAEDINKKCDLLQQLETDTEITQTEELYVKLLLCHLYRDDLCSAKFLWKRIPNVIKEQSTVLQNLWNVGKALWKKDAVAVHIALQAVEWPPVIAGLVNQMKDNYRMRSLQLISRAYDSLPLSDFANSLGLPLHEAVGAVQKFDWGLSDGTSTNGVVYVYPRKIQVESEKGVANDDHLRLLTSVVSFLEN